jgi:hypothetical protein
MGQIRFPARLLAAMAMTLVLSGCNAKGLLAPDPAAQKVAEAAYAHLVMGEYSDLTADWPAEYKTPQQLKLIAALREMIPEGQAKPGLLVGINKNVTTSGHTQALTYDYDYGAEKVRVTATLQRKDDTQAWKLMGLNMAPAVDSGGFDFGHASAPPPVKPAAKKEPEGSKSAGDQSSRG